MFTFKVQAAYKNYLSENLSEALDLYEELSKEIGNKFFEANTQICKANFCKDIMNIVFICDQNFVLPTAVSIKSLIINKEQDSKYIIYILSQNISVESCQFLESFSCFNVAIVIKQIDTSFEDFKIIKNGFHVSTAAIIKFEIPNILKRIDKALYIDGDVVVQKDLSFLFHYNIKNKFAAVVKDIRPLFKYSPNILKKLSIEHHSSYFNSGVILLNLKKMREENISEKLFQYRKHGLNYFMDQDALNVVFNDNVKYVPLKWNFLSTLPECFSDDEIAEYYRFFPQKGSKNSFVEEASILHFTSKKKPWCCEEIKYSDRWYKYLLLLYKERKNNIEALIPKVKQANNIIVSLTSFPARINYVHNTIASLLQQSFSASQIILWLSEEEFPYGRSSLPESLLSLENNIFKISWYPTNLRSYLKLIPSLNAYPEAAIVTADDDILYHTDWLLQLAAAYISNPKKICCHRAHKMVFNDSHDLLSYRKWEREIKQDVPTFRKFFTGVGGVLYPPASLYGDVCNEKLFLKLSPYGDDIWFWAMSVLKGTHSCLIENSSFKLKFVADTQEVGLCKKNDSGGRNDVMLNNIFSYYKNLYNIIESECRDD